MDDCIVSWIMLTGGAWIAAIVTGAKILRAERKVEKERLWHQE